MPILDTLRGRFKKESEKVEWATARVWDYLETKAAKAMDHIPWWEKIKAKASHLTEEAVGWVGEETKTMIAEWKDAVEHLKNPPKSEEKKPATPPPPPTLGSDIVSGIQKNMK